MLYATKNDRHGKAKFLADAKERHDAEQAEYEDRRRKLASITNPIRRRAERVALDEMEHRLKNNAAVLGEIIERHNLTADVENRIA